MIITRLELQTPWCGKRLLLLLHCTYFSLYACYCFPSALGVLERGSDYLISFYFTSALLFVPTYLHYLSLLSSLHTVTHSVTRLLYYFSIFGFLEKWKFAQNYKIFAKVGLLFCQILNSYSRYGQKLIKILPKWRIFTKSGHTDCESKVFIHMQCAEWVWAQKWRKYVFRSFRHI